MPTTNPVPSQDPSDLLFNAEKLDEVLNGTGTSFTDRLGTARRTVAGMNADFDAQLADAESYLNVYRADAAASAAEALGYLQTIRATSYGAYANDPATDPLGNPPTVGDEYFNTTANLLKRWNGTTWQASDINTANLAASSGSSMVGYDGQTVQDVLDGAKSLQDYAALRAYTGRATRIYITGLLATAKPAGIAGVFQYDQTDATSSDNGGTIIVDASGRRWKRDFDGEVFAKWFGVVANGTTIDTDAFNRLLAYANSKKAEIKLPAGDILLNEAIIIPDNGLRKISGEGQQASRLVFDISSGTAFTVASYYTRPVFCEGFDVVLKNQANTVSGLKVSFGNTGSWGGGMIADRFNVLDFTGTVAEFVEAFSSNFRMCEFRGGLQGGVKTAKLLKTSYTTYFGANNSFTNCVFHIGKIGFQNFGGTTYDFNSCTFENLTLFANVKQLAGLSMYGSWESCWFEDITNGIINAEIDETTLLPLSPVQNKANISRLYFYANMTSAGVNPVFLNASVEPFLYDKFRLDSGINRTYQGAVHYQKYTFNNGLPNNVEDLRLISQTINITEVNYKPFYDVLRNGQYIVTVEVTGFNNYKMYAVFVSGGFKTPLTLVGTVTDANTIGSSYKIQLLWADDIQITAQAYGKGLVSLNAYISFVPFKV